MHAVLPGHHVTRVHLWSRLGVALGYTVSAYVTRGVLVDSGFPGAAREMAALLDRLRPRGAFVTHLHEDHAGNAPLLARRRIPLAAGPQTLAALRAPTPIRWYRRAVWGTPGAVTDAITPFADDALALIPAPGHSADHHVVWDRERGHLFGGDLFLGVKVRIAHSSENPRVLVRTLRQLAALSPAMLFDAHRGALPDAAPLLRAKADWLEETIAAADRLADGGADDGRVRRELFGPERLVAYGSTGEYSALNLARAIRASRVQAAPRTTLTDAGGIP